MDFDGVIVKNDNWQGVDFFGEIIPGAKEFLETLGEKYHVVIYTCRCTEGINGIEKANLLVNRVRGFLDEHNIYYDEIFSGQGKPIATAYIDDRGINCNPVQNPNDFEKVLILLE